MILPELSAGDLDAVPDAGAYGFTTASQYNGRPRCPGVLIPGSQAGLMHRGGIIAGIPVAMECPARQK